jgi:hypothetical protein
MACTLEKGMVLAFKALVRRGTAMQHAIAVLIVERLIGSKPLVVQASDVCQQQHSQQRAANNKPAPHRNPLPQSITHRVVLQHDVAHSEITDVPFTRGDGQPFRSTAVFFWAVCQISAERMTFAWNSLSEMM